MRRRARDAAVDRGPADHVPVWRATPRPDTIGATGARQLTCEGLEGALDGPVVALHSGSLALTMPPGAAGLRDLMAKAAATATISYDPNCRPMLMGDPGDVLVGVCELLATADVVK